MMKKGQVTNYSVGPCNAQVVLGDEAGYWLGKGRLIGCREYLLTICRLKKN